jgi:hypothetical protein
LLGFSFFYTFHYLVYKVLMLIILILVFLWWKFENFYVIVRLIFQIFNLIVFTWRYFWFIVKIVINLKIILKVNAVIIFIIDNWKFIRWIRYFFLNCNIVGIQGQGDNKFCSYPNFAVNLDVSSHLLNYLFAYAQSKACPFSIHLFMLVQFSKICK